MARNRLGAELAIVALIAAAALGFGIQRAGMASGYVDPLLRAGAQDESVYGHAAANMVHTGHWLTPVFLDRFLLNKPPLLMWAGALAMRCFGLNPVALRLPAIAAGLLCCLLVYWWLRLARPATAAWSGVLLLLGNALFHSMTRKFMTDAVLMLLVTAAMFTLALDPGVRRAATAIGFGILSGAAILTKSAAGFVPLLILVAYYFLSSPKGRPALGRIGTAIAVALLVAAPWHLYQFLVHRDWFLAEYVRFQLLGSGINAPSRYTSESNLSFYAWRLVALDPVLLLLWFGAAAFWKRHAEEEQARMVAVWCLATFLCPLAFGTRVAYYLLPLVPAMVVMAVRFSPLFQGRRAGVLCGLLAVSFGVKVWQSDAPWGLDYKRASVPSAAALEKYSQLHRANDIVIVSPDDEFYSAILDLPKVRYAYLGTVDPTKTTEFFYWLGVNVSAQDFCNLDALTPGYGQHLAAWGLPETKPVGTIIAGGSNRDLSRIVRCSEDRDFFLPDGLRAEALESGLLTHVATESENGRFFLLARNWQRRPENSHQPGAIFAAEARRLMDSVVARTLSHSPPFRAPWGRSSSWSLPYPDRSSP